MNTTLPPLRPLLSKLRNPLVIVTLLATFAVPLAIYLAPKQVTGIWDLQLPFGLFLMQTLLGLALVIALRQDLVAFLKPLLPKKREALAGLITLALLTWASISWIEARHRVQSDESIYLAAAQNLYHHGSAGACDEGIFTEEGMDCLRKANNFKAKGLSWLMLLGMPIFGSDMQWIFGAHMVLFVFTGLMFFLAIMAWTRNAFLSIVSTVLLLAQPTLLFQFRALSVEPLYVFMSALSLFLLRWAWERNSLRHWLLLALSMAFFAQTRQETVFCLFAFSLVAMLKLLPKPDLRFPAFFLGLAVFIIPVLLTISHYQGYGFQGGEYAAHGHFLNHLKINWGVMTQTPMQGGLLGNPFLSYFAWLALFGGFTLIIKAFLQVEYRRQLFFLLLYHLQTYMIFENSSGDFTIEINQRYALVIFPTMAFLGALFLHAIIFELLPRLLEIRKPNAESKIATIILCLTLGLIFWFTARHAQSLRANIMYNRNHLTMEQAEIKRWQAVHHNDSALYVYARPWHFTGYGQSAIHYDRLRNATDAEIQQWLQRFGNNIFYVRGMDCWDSRTYHRKAVENRIPGVCDHFENRFALEALHRTSITNNYLLQISRLVGIRETHSLNLFQLGVFNFLETPTPRLLVSYAMQDTSARTWQMRLTLNDSLLSQFPYEARESLDTFPNPPLQPGFNTLRLELLDENGTSLLHKEESRFFDKGLAVLLSQLPTANVFQGWGELQKNRSVMGRALTVNGKVFEHGLGTHAPARLTYELGGKYRRFQAQVGLDDSELCGDGVQFVIRGDEKVLLTTPVVPILTNHPIDLDITGVHSLILEVDSVGNMNCDHANWLQPVLIKDRN